MEDPSEAPADQRPLFLVNVYVIHTVRFLNKFAEICEQKLAEVHRRILRMDATLALLEAKLRSIDGLDRAVESSPPHGLSEHHIPVTEGISEDDSGAVSSSREVLTSSTSTTAIEQRMDSDLLSPRTGQQAHLMIKDDPRFSRFFRMLRVGVPEKGVKLQMSLEGYDPTLLDNPEAGVPPV